MRIIVFLLCFIFGGSLLSANQQTINAEEMYLKTKYESAAKELKQQLEKDPTSARIHNNLACTMFQLNQKEEAIKHWQLALENSPDSIYSARINYNIGNYYYKNNQKDKAIESYKNALRLNPDDRLAKYNLEVALMQNPPPPPNNSNSPNNQNNNNPPQEDNKPQSQQQPQMSKEEAERLLNALQKNERGPNHRKDKQDNTPSSSTGRDW
ncbi:MAG: tetratricopeptide repeat protein [Acidobacteria bacterium]|nr:tetratricopeptide repeat protein [Acidobacteriota bacterium]